MRTLRLTRVELTTINICFNRSFVHVYIYVYIAGTDVHVSTKSGRVNKMNLWMYVHVHVDISTKEPHNPALSTNPFEAVLLGYQQDISLWICYLSTQYC